METFTFNPGVFFLIILAIAVIAFAAGWLLRKEKDKPVLILREDIPDHAKEFLHHVHPHDKIDLTKNKVK